MHIRILTVGLVLAAECAFAQPVFADERPPRFDFDALCNSRAITTEGFSPESKATCMSAQGDALDAVRRVWPNISVDIQDNCSYQAKADRDGDYQILEACIRSLARQQQDNQGGLTRPKAKAKSATAPK
ncbi:MAG: hypothetical protein LCH56_09930 [Proteobacteria bacterium]|nr:hypothetical protein [Pseudomonadota bacterium]